MTQKIAVDVVDVSKRFRLYHEKVTSLKERALRAGRNPHEDFWALRDVAFSVYEGETVGILGRNGSGKSTMLKCVSGILQPTEGRVVVRGQLAALLELGAGFQPELSGRDNIYLNASLLGLSTREVQSRFDDIVSFAELEQFIDNQVKFYSSGMFVRLGFAVAVNVDPDVLVVDEVLAVGDENFQRKCLGRIKQFQDEGRTILFVTHAADLVRQICDRAVVLEGGRVLAVAGAAEAIRAYHEHLVAVGVVPEPADESQRPILSRHRPITMTSVELEHAGTGSRPYLLPGEPMTLRLAYEAVEAVPSVVFSYAISSTDGALVHATDTAILDRPVDIEVGTGRVEFRFDEVPLLGGSYMVHVAISGGPAGVVYDLREQDAAFEVMNPGRARGSVALEPRVEISTASLS